jgi:hypothetical protein
MSSSGIIHRVALVGTDILEECNAFNANVVPSSLILVTLMMKALRSSATSVLTVATWCNIPEDGILHSLKYYTVLILVWKVPAIEHHKPNFTNYVYRIATALAWRVSNQHLALWRWPSPQTQQIQPNSVLCWQANQSLMPTILWMQHLVLL